MTHCDKLNLYLQIDLNSGPLMPEVVEKVYDLAHMLGVNVWVEMPCGNHSYGIPASDAVIPMYKASVMSVLYQQLVDYHINTK